MNHIAEAGRVEWIGIRHSKKANLIVTNSVVLDPSYGIEGDHCAGRSGKRQVTSLQAEHLLVIAGMLQAAFVKPKQLRRNIDVRGFNLLVLT
ncbi:MAG: hypothetical protein JSW10_05825 [Pseudomonadota bacterium]|nr:MAG: hypothetical protein JSW10_05825 [Pseudomonadota bacterium]